MSVSLKRRPRTPWRAFKDGVHAAQEWASKASGRPGGGFMTDLTLAGRPVIFIHNPKAGGTSLGRFLGVRRRTHAFPADRLSERAWLNCFSIVVVRDPFERFLSCYYGNVIRPGDNGLTKRYGPGLKSLNPFDFLSVLLDNPKFGGAQVNWTDFPSRLKPRADLVLRFEDMAEWKPMLISHGLPVENRDLRHENRSERGDADHLARLRLTEAEFGRLRGAVRTAFDCDWQAFAYRSGDQTPGHGAEICTDVSRGAEPAAVRRA